MGHNQPQEKPHRLTREDCDGAKIGFKTDMNDNTETQDEQVSSFTMKDRLEWYWLVCADPDLPASAKLVASRLALYHCNSKTGQCNPSAKTLAAAVGRHPRAIDPVLKALKKAGWISWKTKTGMSNAYRLERMPTRSTTTETADSSPEPMQQTTDPHEQEPMASTAQGVCSALHTGGMQSTAEKPGSVEPGREPGISLPPSTAGAAKAGSRPSASGGVRKTVKTPLPADFELTHEREVDAQLAGLKMITVRETFRAFKDHAIDTARQSADWDAAWRNWCRNAAERQKAVEARAGTGRPKTSRYTVPREQMR